MANSARHTEAIGNIPDFYQGSAMFLKKEVERYARNLCFLGEEEEIGMFTAPSEENEDICVEIYAESEGDDSVRVLITRDETAAITSERLTIFPCGKHYKKLVKEVAEAVVRELCGITEQ